MYRSAGVGGGDVDVLVYGEGLAAGVVGEDLGCATCGCEEDGLELHGGSRADEGAHEGGLARAGIASQEEGGVGGVVVEEADQLGARLALVGRGGMPQVEQDEVFYALSLFVGHKVGKKTKAPLAYSACL